MTEGNSLFSEKLEVKFFLKIVISVKNQSAIYTSSA